MNVYQRILNGKAKGEKSLAVLIDPDKIQMKQVEGFIQKVNATKINFIFVGGSIVQEQATETIVVEIKKHTQLPVVIFPGDITQITNQANALLFLSLLSGRNPDYLIGKHVEAIPRLKNTTLEIIPTGYVLIENGKQTSVEKVSQTKPLGRDNIQLIVDTAKAGELLGLKLMYLEAGSGAIQPISEDIVKAVQQELTLPLIVGGGIRTLENLTQIHQAGADLVVIGTVLEENETFFNQLKK